MEHGVEYADYSNTYRLIVPLGFQVDFLQRTTSWILKVKAFRRQINMTSLVLLFLEITGFNFRLHEILNNIFNYFLFLSNSKPNVYTMSVILSHKTKNLPEVEVVITTYEAS